ILLRLSWFGSKLKSPIPEHLRLATPQSSAVHTETGLSAKIQQGAHWEYQPSTWLSAVCLLSDQAPQLNPVYNTDF
ncbi:MAG: hypothetical protein KTR24_04625, partial [Saprospiraceae bacterium]|nr:hypothetical protein [Saprospiraceae bacterium]